MNGIVKALTCILGVLAVVACLATVGIIGYSFMSAPDQKKTEASQNQDKPQEMAMNTATAENLSDAEPAVPTKEPENTAKAENEAGGEGQTPEPLKTQIDPATHVHDYEESVEKKATCYSAGKIKYTCECGDEYYVDVMSTGHVAGDWEVTRKPTSEKDGLRVKKCIYCDEIVAQETVSLEEGKAEDNSTEKQSHEHQYAAETVREPTCVLAGLRRYNCNCGSFYTEMIPAPGHVASDWTVAAEPTTTYMGTEQRTCKVCGVVLDSRPVNKLTASSSPGASTSPSSTVAASPSSGASATASAGASATASAEATATATAAGNATASSSPSASPHSHSYVSYVLKEANCTEKGIRSFVCTCGSSYAESIELDMNNHTFRAVVIPATKTTQGYTVYTCLRCNYSYFDNFVPALSTGTTSTTN